MRREVLQANYKTLPNTAIVGGNCKGEVNTPEIWWNSVGGLYIGHELTAARTYRIKSISEDVVFATTSGRQRPAKHLQIGIAIKSLTGSEKLLPGWIALATTSNTTE